MTDSINVPLLEGNIPGQGVSVPFHPDVTEWHKPGLVAENHLHHFREGYVNLRLRHILAALLKGYRSEFWETHPLLERIPCHPDAKRFSEWKTRCKSLAGLGKFIFHETTALPLRRTSFTQTWKQFRQGVGQQGDETERKKIRWV